METVEVVSALKAREYDDLPVELCNAVYDTITKSKYKTGVIRCEDLNLIDWVDASGLKKESPATIKKIDFAFIDGEVTPGELEQLAVRMRPNGQAAFHRSSVRELRTFFNAPSRYDKWSTIEIALGEGLFIARRLS